MAFAISEKVQHKEDVQTMVVTGYASGMVECRWYDGYATRSDERYVLNPAQQLASWQHQVCGCRV